MGSFMYLAKYFTALICAYVFIRWLVADTFIASPKIAEIASRDLSHVGRYDNRLSTSVKYWITAILCSFYNDGHIPNIVTTTLYDWVENYVYDPDSIIRSGMYSAINKVQEEIVDARKEERPVEFNVSPHYNWHDVPKSFEYNDYIEYQVLIDKLDKLEVSN